jgi:ribulose-phosphate 3-epimerase
MNIDLPVLAPSILAADFSKLGDQIQECLDAGITWIHCDIMDGHFVPNISYGPSIVKSVRGVAPDAFLDVHLMIENPDQYIEDFADAGADLISVHYEACPHLHRTLQNISQNGCMTGVVINPATSVDVIKPVLPIVDLVLVMSVNPGFGGQKFIESSYQKVEELRKIKLDEDLNFLIEIDGGVSLKNIEKLAKAGTDILVAGSSVFKTDDIPSQIEALTAKAESGHAKLS